MASPKGQGATFVELFFDLVFVFAITQVTHYAAHHLDLDGLRNSLIIFWLIWWGWTQFTWALNAADTDHHHVRVATLVAAGVAFVMAVSVDRSFLPGSGTALWFALSYVTCRAIGLRLYYKVVSDNTERRSAVVTFSVLSIAGMAAVVLGSLVEPSARALVWAGAIALDLGAAWVSGRSIWGIHAGHFAERHGLIVIIALGESLIVAGSALTSEVTTDLMLTAGTAVVVSCLLWWTYFGWVRAILAQELNRRQGRDRSLLARDAYTFWHFPLVSGIIALAVGLEASFHPDEYASTQVAMALAVGLTLFLTSTAGALWRALGCVLWNRMIVLALTIGALAFVRESPPTVLLGVACAGLVLIVVIEQITIRPQLERR